MKLVIHYRYGGSSVTSCNATASLAGKFHAFIAPANSKLSQPQKLPIRRRNKKTVKPKTQVRAVLSLFILDLSFPPPVFFHSISPNSTPNSIDFDIHLILDSAPAAASPGCNVLFTFHIGQEGPPRNCMDCSSSRAQAAQESDY